ncbi:MAG TPA: gamma-glutamyl-phosphate reductase, partial [Microbacterium sp.]|nr:gamma-glutamyl-phosphate reductase [Microbacterium sp.]
MTTTATTARERMLLAQSAARTIGLLGDAEKRDALLAIAEAIDEAA